MRRTFLAKISILAGAALTALILTVVRPSPEGLMPFGVGQAEVRAAPGTPAAKLPSNYNLSALAVISSTLQKVDDNYVDRTRIDPKAMLLAALDYVQARVAEVMVEPSADKKSVTVQVNDKQQTFSVADVDSPWRLHARLKEIFRFIQANMNPTSDPRDIEYAAANGMLSTLDPHSVLLDPEQAEDMEISTTGKFGGIGIVIGMRKSKLSVIKLISADTPAAKAGLKAGDHIVKINAEPTVNLTLNEAMNRLRGDPGTKVMVTIERKGETATREVPLTRSQIMVSSIEDPRILAGNVGYMKVTNFAQSTASDLKHTMDDLRKQGARAWVLDLRNNPGGLLQQAIEVTDIFVEQGTIVTTVGYGGKQREEKRAKVAGTDNQAPLAVLVNGGSASASEIVAGALKNLNRGVIIGQTTFGKGSVQVIFDNNDESKLKLTIAQYLTPGDISIQSVGITPDIELVKVRTPEQMKGPKDILDLTGKSHYMREADLDAHLTSKNTRKGEKPAESVKYLYVAPKKAATADDDDDDTATPDGQQAPEDEEIEEPVDGFVEDYEIQFARDFVANQSASSKRTDSIANSKTFVAKKRAEEDAKITQALSKLGVDWSLGARGTGAHLTATFTTDKPQNKIAAGDVVGLTATVTNNGTVTAYRVHNEIKSDDWTFKDKELVFGKIDPGQSKTWTTYLRVPKGAITRMDELEWNWSEQNGAKVDAQPLKLALDGRQRPLYAYSYQLIDEKGNGDGLAQLGESFRLHVTVKNLGAGASHKTDAQISNKSGDGVVVNKGRFELTDLGPGETKTVDFTFDTTKELTQKEVMLELVVYDAELGENVSDKLRFPVRTPTAGPAAASGKAKITKKDIAIREGAADDSAIIGTAKKGAVFTVTGKQGTWTRVEIEPGRQGFVPSGSLSSGGGAATAGGFTPVWQVTPPTIALGTQSTETGADHYKLSGSVQDDNHVEDVYVVVSNSDAKIDGKKVLYRSNRGGKNSAKLDFSGEIPVWPGSNMVTVVARENNEVRSMYTMYVYRNDKKGPQTAATSPDGAK